MALKMGLMRLIRQMGLMGYAKHTNTLVSLVLFVLLVLFYSQFFYRSRILARVCIVLCQGAGEVVAAV